MKTSKTTLGKISFVGLSIAGLAFLTPIVFAAPDTLNFGTELNTGQCDKIGKPVVNVVQKVINSIDSGEAGNNWAFDNYNRHIQVWAQTDGTYCAVLHYQGKFDGQAGEESPGNTGILSGDEDGAFEGGYRATITGTLKTTPDWPTRGSLGTFDYDCDLDGNCPGAIAWFDQYFESGYSYTLDWWGWIYHGGKCGTWVNSSYGNAGDIVCS